MSLRVSHRPLSEPVAVSVLLDTNVASELIRKVPESTVVTWTQAVPWMTCFFIRRRSGVALRCGHPPGRRRDTLFLEIEAMLRDAFDDRVLPFDSDAARATGEIRALLAQRGQSIGPHGRPKRQPDRRSASALHRKFENFIGSGDRNTGVFLGTTVVIRRVVACCWR